MDSLKPPMALEKWKPAPGFGESYEVSSHGRVRRSGLARGCRVGRILKPTPNAKGYLRVKLSVGNRTHDRYVHRLVAAAFLGPPPAKRPEANHRDGIRSNNDVENLEYVSSRENKRHAIAIGLGPVGERNAASKLTRNEVREIRQSAGKIERRRLAKRYGVSKLTIRLIQTHKTWRHLL